MHHKPEDVWIEFRIPEVPRIIVADFALQVLGACAEQFLVHVEHGVVRSHLDGNEILGEESVI